MPINSRAKGQAAEREVAALIYALTGWEVRRRIENKKDDNDLIGIPGWCAEVKRYAKFTPALLAFFWEQTVRQAKKHGGIPVMFYRANQAKWRAVVPASHFCGNEGEGYEWTMDMSLECWAMVARDGAQDAQTQKEPTSAYTARAKPSTASGMVAPGVEAFTLKPSRRISRQA